MPQSPFSNAAVRPKVKYIRQRLDHTIQLSMEKAAAHLKAPSQYPLPAGKESLEYAFIDLLKVLPKRKQDKFLDKMKEALNASGPARKQKYGALAAVDLSKATAIADQVNAVAVPDNMKITEEDLAQLKQENKKTPTTKAGYKVANIPVQPRQAAPGTTLQFAVENISCIETNDRRKDEVSFSAFITDSAGVQQERSNFFVADFKKDDSRSPGAAGNLFTINLGDSTGGVFPASFAAGVLIVEEGFFGGGDAVEKTGAILRLIGKLIAVGGMVASFFPAVGVPLGLAIIGIGAVITGVGDILLFAGGDEISQIIPDELLFQTPPLAGETFARTVEVGFLADGFIKKGKYAVDMRWTVA